MRYSTNPFGFFHAMRFRRLRNEHRAGEEWIRNALRLKHEVAAQAKGNLDATGVDMLFRTGTNGLEVAQAQERDARNAMRAQIKRSTLLPVHIDYRIFVYHLTAHSVSCPHRFGVL